MPPAPPPGRGPSASPPRRSRRHRFLSVRSGWWLLLFLPFSLHSLPFTPVDFRPLFGEDAPLSHELVAFELSFHANRPLVIFLLQLIGERTKLRIPLHDVN